MFEHHTQITLTYTILKTVIYISIHVHVYPSKVKCKIKPFHEAIGRWITRQKYKTNTIF